MTMTDDQRRYLSRARVGRLATADAAGRPHVVPCCFALTDGDVVTPLDEKPKSADRRDLRRVRDVEENGYVALVADHYREDWSALGWVQVRGTAEVVAPGEGTDEAVAALRGKYDQYERHRLEELPLLRIDVGHVVSWGTLSPGEDT